MFPILSWFLPFLTFIFCCRTGTLPKAWNRYKVPEGIPANQWVIDFSQRIKQLDEIERHIVGGAPLQKMPIWLGGLFVPEAFITATRQSVAQANSWPLEKLLLQLDVCSMCLCLTCWS